MGSTAGTLSWQPHANDAQFLHTFREWAQQDGIGCDEPKLGVYDATKTQFVVDLSGFSRNSKRVQTFIERCASALKMNNIQGVTVVVTELPM